MGNICRSPTVEAVARTHFARAGVALRLASAGTESYHTGDAADARSIATASARGYSLAEHRARRVADADFADFDWLLAMDQHNFDTLRARCPPPYLRKLALFLPFAGIDTPRHVPDPYYGEQAHFDEVLDLSERGVKALLARPEYVREMQR